MLGSRQALLKTVHKAIEYRRRLLPMPGASTIPSQKPLAHLLESANCFDCKFGRINFKISHACPNVRFIHIGKTGGSTVRWNLLSAGVYIEEFHVRRPVWSPNTWYFFWIRNPLRRFVSAFNFSKEVITFDFSNLTIAELTMENCPAPEKIQRRMERGFAYEPSYDNLVLQFDSANALAESLTSNNSILRHKAHQLMRHYQEHIFKGIGWYLDNGAFVRNFHRQILLVGRTEAFDQDLARLEDALGISLRQKDLAIHKRKDGSNLKRDLSSKAISNLRHFYANSDYAALRQLMNKGFISADVYDSYREY